LDGLGKEGNAFFEGDLVWEEDFLERELFFKKNCKYDVIIRK
jgi:hypothetical protein